MTTYQRPMDGHAIALSISESPDMPFLGLAAEHLNDAMVEVARHLVAMGAVLLYGGDLRPKGFTEILLELVIRYQRLANANDRRTVVRNFLAWPIHVNLPINEVHQLSEDLSDIAELLYLTLNGDTMTLEDREQLDPRPATKKEWIDGLSAMRKTMTKMSDARIVLGGRTENFNGKMPGVAEEALCALRAHQPLFLLGGFGGCAHDIAKDLGLVTESLVTNRDWPSRGEFAGFTASDLNNGLDLEENIILATTVHIDQAMALILRGLFRQYHTNPSSGG